MAGLLGDVHVHEDCVAVQQSKNKHGINEQEQTNKI